MGVTRKGVPQSITVEYTVTGALDGETPAPQVIVDPTADDRTPFDAGSQVYRPEPVENLGLIDPDLLVSGSIGVRCIPFVMLDTEETGDASASLDVVAVRLGEDSSVVLQKQIRNLAGTAGPVFLDAGFNVPQGSDVRLRGFVAVDEPIRVRVTILVADTCEEVAAFRCSCPDGGGTEEFGQRNVGLVDPVNGNDATGAIGTALPFQTIQGFIDAVPQGDDSDGARNVFVAQISPADYDEDLAIDISRRRIILTGPGPWGLGTFDSGDWGPSGTRRNIVVTGSDLNVDGIRPGLVISANLPLSEAMTTHESYLTKPRISGKIDLTGASGLGSVELALSCEIFGDAGVSIDAGATIIQSYMYHCRMRGTLVGSNWQFQVAQRSRFDGLINVDNYSLIQSCRINAGMTIAGSGFSGIRPNGILLTNFDGLYTGSVGSFNCDAYTNYWQKTFNLAGVTVAQKTIQGDLVA